MHIINIWEPRYSTGDVLIGSWHVRAGTNKIRFTKTKMAERLMSSHKIRSYPQESIDGHWMYAVPLDDFEVVAPAPQQESRQVALF